LLGHTKTQPKRSPATLAWKATTGSWGVPLALRFDDAIDDGQAAPTNDHPMDDGMPLIVISVFDVGGAPMTELARQPLAVPVL
jgi:hypothetical protein